MKIVVVVVVVVVVVEKKKNNKGLLIKKRGRKKKKCVLQEGAISATLVSAVLGKALGAVRTTGDLGIYNHTH